MQVTVRLFAGLRERAGTDLLTLGDLPEESDLAGLLAALAERYPELGPLTHVRCVLGDRYASESEPLPGGGEVCLIPPVSGGAAEDEALARGVFELAEAPLDVEGCRRRVGHASCGANVVFTGTTRERNRGEDVVRLDYEAFEAMAGAEMGRIFAECAENLGTGAGADEDERARRALRMLCVHRTGVVEVGEPSIVVAVASPHRDAAFQAARFLIDELKARVPLWKKEVYADGHHWIGERS
jgi:molybdopterin synthase catalytic subunit